ncbi:zinc finger protein 821-like [Hetaerina americana]|uniref:zinc finger protein 821-like n=1 Tax=Hetaerina americana TaxID=62018 RepID=UPI003A7F1B2C
MSNYLNVNPSIPEAVNLQPTYHTGINELPVCVTKSETTPPPVLVVTSYNVDSSQAEPKPVPSMTPRAVETRNRRQFETQEQREARLQRQREANRRRRESETDEQRAVRLMANRRRLANESFEKRQARLADLSRRQKQRLASETPDQRAARLAYLSRRQKERRANIMATRSRQKYEGCSVQTCCRCECMAKPETIDTWGLCCSEYDNATSSSGSPAVSNQPTDHA